MRFSCVALRSVTMRQDIISIFADVLFSMLKKWARLEHDLVPGLYTEYVTSTILIEIAS